MPSLLIYTDPTKLGLCEMPLYVVGDDQNWSLQFSNGVNLYDPTGVSIRFGHMNGLNDLTYTNAFEWIDRLNNRHVGSFSIASGVPVTPTWDEDPIQVQGNNGCWLIRGRTPPSSQIRKVGVIYGGSGLSSAPRVDFNGGGLTETGKGATATCTISGNAVNAVTVTNRGHNYSVVPAVYFTGGGGSGATAYATLTNGQVSAITVQSGGASYTSAPTVTIIDPEASATASVAGSCAVQSLILSNGGAGYTSAPTVGFSGGGGSSAAATASLLNSTWGLSKLTLTNAGSGFTSAPTVSFSGGTGSGATAVATVSPSGYIDRVTISAPGDWIEPLSGAGAFSVAFTGGGGSGAAGTVILVTNATGHVEIYGIRIDSAGSGYTAPPTVTVTPGTGYTQVLAPSLTAVVATGTITALTLTNPGSGYGSTAPTVAFTGGGGTAAAATAVLIGSPVGSLSLTNAGSGYTSPPTLAFTGGSGTGAAAIAVLSGGLGVTAITLVQPGFAYTTLPSVTLYPGAGAVLEPQGIETNPTPYVRNHDPAGAVSSIVAIPFSRGRTDSNNNLIYDDSLLIIKPRTLLTPTLTLQGDGLTWAGVFTPVTAFVTAVLNFRRSCVVDVEIFGGGRVLHQGKLTIQNKMS